MENLRTAKQMLRALSQLASDNVLAQSSVFFVFFLVGYLRNKFQVPNFLFSSLWQLGRRKYSSPTAAEDL